MYTFSIHIDTIRQNYDWTRYEQRYSLSIGTNAKSDSITDHDLHLISLFPYCCLAIFNSIVCVD